MDNHLTICFCLFTLVPAIVLSSDIYSLKKRIQEMNEQSKLFERENDALVQKLQEERQTCLSKLGPLQEQKAAIEEKHGISLQELDTLSNNITQKRIEEQLLVKALSREYNIRSKYNLQITLYTQEMELFGTRRRDGTAEKCRLLKPLFKKYESLVSARSSSRRPISSDKDKVLVLESELANYKLEARRLQNRNEELKADIEKEVKLCEIRINDEKEAIQSDLVQLQKAVEDIDFLTIELKELIDIVKDLHAELEKFQKENEILRQQSAQLRNEMRAFEHDLDCYGRMFNLKINYQ